GTAASARTLRTEQRVKPVTSSHRGRFAVPWFDDRTHMNRPVRGAGQGRSSGGASPVGRPPKDSEASALGLLPSDLYGGFDPGSGRTLAARLTHASRTVNGASAPGSVANGCVTRGQPAPDPGITPGNRS